MSECKLCGRPIGLIHRCRISPPEAERSPLIERVRRALMMHEAGYDVGPSLLIELAVLELARYHLREKEGVAAISEADARLIANAPDKESP